MTDPVYKILLFMKRRPGMSVADFRAYYETRHVPLCERYGGGLGRYVRRYIDPQPHPETGPAGELPFDVITELWFGDERVFKGALAHLTTAIMPDEIVADELNLFDRGSFRIATVVEHASG
ncbi:MAG: EthD domain-containing protein [Sphingomonas sp.]